MTPEELKIFQTGFKVALNFAHHHHVDAKNLPDKPAQDAFRAFLLKHAKGSEAVIGEAINLTHTMPGQSCPPGFCLNPQGQCVLCSFEFAFEGKFHS